MRSRPPIIVLAAAAGWLAAACTTAPSPAELGLPKVELPKVSMPDVKLPDVKLPKVSGPAVGTPTAVYTRVARGALLCWFGGNGLLKSKYIYHADAEPPSKGGRAEIGIHTREVREEGGSPRGNRVYHISIVPVSDRAEMTAENFGLPDTIAQQLQEDAQRWAASEDEVACRDEAIAQGWDPKAPAAPPVKKPMPVKAVKATSRG